MKACYHVCFQPAMLYINRESFYEGDSTLLPGNDIAAMIRAQSTNTQNKTTPHHTTSHHATVGFVGYTCLNPPAKHTAPPGIYIPSKSVFYARRCFFGREHCFGTFERVYAPDDDEIGPPLLVTSLTTLEEVPRLGSRFSRVAAARNSDY